VLKKIFGLKMDLVPSWRKLYKVFSSLDSIKRVITKSRRMSWARKWCIMEEQECVEDFGGKMENPLQKIY
jgi:hypothetical protein